MNGRADTATARPAWLLALALLGVAAGTEAHRHARLSAPPGPAAGVTGDELDGLLQGRRMDLRRADADAMSAVLGVGPTRARRILEARDAGRLGRWSEVGAVPGVGPATVARLQRYADISP